MTMTRSALRGGDRAHHRPLAAVAVAAGAEHDDEPAARVGPQRIERLGERVGLVRVVDEDRRAVADGRRVRAGPWRRRGARAPRTPRRIAAGGDGKPGGDQRVLDLKLADQRQTHVDMSCRHARTRSACAKPSTARIDEADAVALAADGEHAQAALPAPPRSTAAAWSVIDIDDGGAARRDQMRSNSRSLAAR